MKALQPRARTLVLALVVAWSAAPTVRAQLWRRFAHPDRPHRLINDEPASIPPLFDDPNATIDIPVLVVLLQFSDVSAQGVHTAAFFEDMVFGVGYNDGNVDQPSLREIVEANSNDRVTIVPANEFHGTPDDGVAGWFTSQCPPGETNGLCIVGNTEAGACTVGVPGACEAGGGYCADCNSWDYYRFKDQGKRAEAIRRAIPFIDFTEYDSMDSDWAIGPDLFITDNEIAVVVIEAWPDCVDGHGHTDWGTIGCSGNGTVRPTDPATLSDNESQEYLIKQNPAIIREAGTVQVLAHEFFHQVFGMADLYTCGLPTCSGRYSIMDNQNTQVPHLDPWGKLHLGFITPWVAFEDGTYTLGDAEGMRSVDEQVAQPEALIVYDPRGVNAFNRYFILENRNLIKSDGTFVDAGLAIWRIDDDGVSGADFTPRRDIRLLRRKMSTNDSVALWDGEEQTYYDLTPMSTPANTDWPDGSPSYIEIYDVSGPGTTMTVSIRLPGVFVDVNSSAQPEDGSQLFPHNMVADGVDDAVSSGLQLTIHIAGGNYFEQDLLIDRPVTLMGWRNGAAVIGR